jgi:hypothetical protein
MPRRPSIESAAPPRLVKMPRDCPLAASKAFDLSVTAICDQQRVAEHAEIHRRREPPGTGPARALSCGRSTVEYTHRSDVADRLVVLAPDGADRLGRRPS